jgi:hypothetical protein
MNKRSVFDCNCDECLRCKLKNDTFSRINDHFDTFIKEGGFGEWEQSVLRDFVRTLKEELG